MPEVAQHRRAAALKVGHEDPHATVHCAEDQLANGRDAAKPTASDHHRGSSSPSGPPQTGEFFHTPSRSAISSTPSPANRPAATGHQRRKHPAVRKPHDTDGEQRAEPAKPDPTTLTPRPAPRAPVDPHNTGRVPGYSPAGPGFRDAHSIMVAVPRPEGKAQHAHSPAAPAARVRMAAGRAVRRAPNRTLTSRIQSRHTRTATGLPLTALFRGDKYSLGPIEGITVAWSARSGNQDRVTLAGGCRRR
jgi:hypothetical protein